MRAWITLVGLAIVCALPAGAAGERAPRPRAKAWIVVWSADGNGGLLTQSASTAARPVASLTKLMTAYLVLRYARLDAVVVTTRDAVAVGESVVPLAVGERQTVRDLLAALVVRSANDAAVMLARTVAAEPRARAAIAQAVVEGGRPARTPVARFVALMNAEASALDLHETVYRTPYGLDVAGAHSSARDVLTLSRLLMADARFRALARRSVVVIPGHRLASRNGLLLHYRSLDGVKTGHTDDAGWNLAAHARRAGVEVYAVELGAPTERRRDGDVAHLLDWAFDRVPRATAVRAGSVYGRLGSVRAVAARSLVTLAMPALRLRLRIVLPDRLDHRVRRGDRLGELRVTRLDDGRELGRIPLVADRDGGRDRSGLANLWRRVSGVF